MRNIVITGASRGIGLELARMALRRGDRVLAAARSPGESLELQGLTKTFHERLELAEVDVAEGRAGEVLARALSTWKCVDVLINNAGVYRKGENVEDFEVSFRVNSIAPFLMTKALLPQLRKSDRPKVMQITSLMGSIADNDSGGSYAYRASKAALNMINKSLAHDESWLTTAVVHPGWVRTRMGGDEAPTEVAESAAGIWTVIDKLKPEDSGAFFDYEGERLPW